MAVFVDQDTFGGSQGPKLETISKAVEEFGRAASIQVYGRSQQLPEPGDIDPSILLEMKTTLTGSLDETRVRLIADALEVAFSKPGLDVIALVTRDDALMPLANKLSDLGKTVIALTDGKAPALVSVCDDSVEIEAPRGRRGAPSGRRGEAEGSESRGGRGRGRSNSRSSTRSSAGSARSGRASGEREEKRTDRPARRGRRDASSEPREPAPRRRSRSSTDERPERTERTAVRKTASDEQDRPKRRGRGRSSEPRADRRDDKPVAAKANSMDPSEAFKAIRETVDSLARRFGDAIWSDTLRDELRDSHDLTPGSLGLSTFEQLLREAEKNDALILQRDPRSRKLVIYSLEEDD